MSEEIKRNSLLLRIKNFYIMHPLIVATITVILLCMILGGCQKAKAESAYLPSEFYEMLEEDCTNFGISYSTVLAEFDSYVTENTHFLYYHDEYGLFLYMTFVGSDTTTYGFYSGNYRSAINVSNNTVVSQAFFYNQPYVFSVGGNYSLPLGTVYQYVLEILPSYSGSWHEKLSYRYTTSTRGNDVYDYQWSGYSFDLDVRNTYTANVHYNGWYGSSYGMGSSGSPINIKLDDCYSYGDNVFRLTDNTGNYPLILVKDNWEHYYPSAVEDDRLKIYTINDNTGKDLVFDLDDFDFSNYDGSEAETQNTLIDNEITVTVDYDGEEQVLTLNSNNSDILPAYLIETPLSYFNIDSYNNVKITKVQFSKLIHYRPSEMKPDETESYNIACEYYLKKYVEPIEKGENEYEDDLDGDKLTQSDIDDVYYQIHFSDGAGISFDDYELAPPDGYSIYTVYLKNTSANWIDFMEDWQLTLEEAYMLVLGSYNTKAEVEEYINQWLQDNKAALYWDCIEFDWIQENNSSLTHTYWYYTTEAGRIRSISNVLADMYIQDNEIKVNTAAIFTAIDNIEDESLEFFNAQLEFDNDALDWFRTINNSINSLEFPVYDDTSLLGDIATIIDKLTQLVNKDSGSDNEDDTVAEAIAYYKAHNNNGLPTEVVWTDNKMSIWMAGKVHSWFQGSDAGTTKTLLLNDTFDVMTTVYDAIEDGAYMPEIISDFLKSISGVGNVGNEHQNQYTDITHFFDSNFDPDTYYGVRIGE